MGLVIERPSIHGAGREAIWSWPECHGSGAADRNWWYWILRCRWQDSPDDIRSAVRSDALLVAGPDECPRRLRGYIIECYENLGKRVEWETKRKRKNCICCRKRRVLFGIPDRCADSAAAGMGVGFRCIGGGDCETRRRRWWAKLFCVKIVNIVRYLESRTASISPKHIKFQNLIVCSINCDWKLFHFGDRLENELLGCSFAAYTTERTQVHLGCTKFKTGSFVIVLCN